MNPHIELVKKYLADPTSVTKEELKANRDAAYAAAADAADADYYAYAAYYAAYAAAAYADDAAYAADTAYAADAAYYVKRYKELTNV